MRECKRSGCDGRCFEGEAFGRGFDSRQVHKRVAAVRQPFFGLAGSEPHSSIVNIYIKCADRSGCRINIIVVFFDPDMELRGLALTLPTWMNALERARLKTDMGRASDLMKRQLADILNRFRQQIDQMMEVL